MKMKISLAGLLLLSLTMVHGQSLNGAWRLVEKEGKSPDYEVIKLYSEAYYTYAGYSKDTGEFKEAGGGRYILDFFTYREHVEIDSKDASRSGTTTSYKAVLEDDLLRITNLETGVVERWQKFDDATNVEMTTCWRIHEKQDEGDTQWRRIVYGPRKTVKMLTNTRYQVLAMNSETGEFIGASGGTWYGTQNTYTEHVAFFSKNQENVGRSLAFKKKVQDGLWHHTGRDTEGKILLEKWLRYK